jgi:hypothetical protein
MGEIYGLYSCRDGAVRYVGETMYPRETRFKQHRRDAWKQDTPLRQWLLEEWKDGFPVRHVRLEWCENAQLSDRETEWIGKFPNLDGGLNRSKQHFILEGKDGVRNGTKIS